MEASGLVIAKYVTAFHKPAKWQQFDPQQMHQVQYVRAMLHRGQTRFLQCNVHTGSNGVSLSLLLGDETVAVVIARLDCIVCYDDGHVMLLVHARRPVRCRRCDQVQSKA